MINKPNTLVFRLEDKSLSKLFDNVCNVVKENKDYKLSTYSTLAYVEKDYNVSTGKNEDVDPFYRMTLTLVLIGGKTSLVDDLDDLA